MATLKSIRLRITSVKNTQQITKAMKMVSASKLRKAEQLATRKESYAEKLKQMLHNTLSANTEAEHWALKPNPNKRALVVVFTSDRGLCGGLNNQLCKLVEQHLNQPDFKQASLLVVGRKGRDFFKSRAVQAQSILNDTEELDAQIAKISQQWLAYFANLEFSHLYLGFNESQSIILQKPKLEQVFPLVANQTAPEPTSENLFEPDLKTVLNHLLPTYLEALIHQALAVNQAAEHAARMVSMDAATKNASELQDTLQLQYNRLRQAAITTELMEIISGAESIN